MLPWDEIEEVDHERSQAVAALRAKLVASHEARAAKDVELRYLERRIELSREQRAETRLSLNEATRRLQQDEDEARLLAIENEKRSALGLDPVESLDQLPKDVKDPEDVYRENPFVVESAQVLVDFLSSGV